MADTANLGLTLLEVGQQSKEVQLNTWANAFDKMVLGEFLFANLPAASDNANGFALCTNASGGRTIVRSDGTDWKVVAVEGATVTT